MSNLQAAERRARQKFLEYQKAQAKALAAQADNVVQDDPQHTRLVKSLAGIRHSLHQDRLIVGRKAGAIKNLERRLKLKIKEHADCKVRIEKNEDEEKRVLQEMEAVRKKKMEQIKPPA